jgi:hypothetical protein
MSKVRGVLTVSVAIDPAYVHVEASRSTLLREAEQRLSLLAGHSSLARTTGRADRPSSRNPLRSRKAAQNCRPFAFERRLRRRTADSSFGLTGRAVRALSAWPGASGLQTPRQTFSKSRALLVDRRRELPPKMGDGWVKVRKLSLPARHAQRLSTRKN